MNPDFSDISSCSAAPLRMNVATALNSRYMRYTYVMLTSLFLNQPDAEIHVYLLHSDLSEKDQETLRELAKSYGHTIHYLHINRESFPAALPTTRDWPLEAYYRLLLPEMLPAAVDRILYLDVDMIINQPIRELYETDFAGACFCACHDMGVTFPFPDIRNEVFKEQIAAGFTYFNSGLLLFNLDALRKRYSFQSYMELARTLNYQILAPDQDLLNYMHWKEVRFLDEYRYNLFSKIAYNHGIHYEQVKAETAIVHYAGMKPWEGQYVHYDIEQLWWDYAKRTPFYAELMEEFLHNSLQDSTVYDTLLSLSTEKKNLMAELAKSASLCQQLLHMLPQNKNDVP